MDTPFPDLVKSFSHQMFSLPLGSQVPTNRVQRRVQEFLRFTKQLQRVHPNVLAKALSRGILYQDKDLVVINKPYGLPVHGKGHVQRGEGVVAAFGCWGKLPCHL